MQRTLSDAKLVLTGSKNLGEDALLVAAVDVVGGLSSLVGPVEKTTVFRVAEKKLSQSAAPPTYGDMKRCVPSLESDRDFRFNTQQICY